MVIILVPSVIHKPSTVPTYLQFFLLLHSTTLPLQVAPIMPGACFITSQIDVKYTETSLTVSSLTLWILVANLINSYVFITPFTALQAGRSRVLSSMASLEFFMDITFLPHHDPGGRLSLQQKRAPYHLHLPTVLKSGSLNLLEPSGPVQACTAIALPLLPLYLLTYSMEKSPS